MKTKFISKTNSGIELYELENDNGMIAQIITFGARIHKLFVPNRDGKLIDVVAGFENLDGYRNDHGTYFGAIIGRVGNRIGKGKFTLNGKEYSLFTNDGNNHLHGGKEGFDKKLWNAKIGDGASLILTYLSEDGEEGYSGNMQVKVVYSLTNDNELKIEYSATCDKDTLCSLTNHAYFNLDGDFKSVLDHEIYIGANALTAVDDELIPHGELLQVASTAFDFTTPKKLGRDINADEHMLKIARGGYDFNYVLNCDNNGAVATAYSEKSGVKMSVFTDRPCMQFYTGNFLDGFVGKTEYPYQSAFCMETQGYPNACNVDSFPTMTLKAGEQMHTVTEYKFELK
ncbi:MAG: galactose mutarotase [Clostridia bacterium]|nr:galactose mutarotase [Clostridia bacterium]